MATGDGANWVTQAEVNIEAGTGTGLALGWDWLGGRLNPDLLPVLLGAWPLRRTYRRDVG